jgi:hypothetical protein
VVAVLILTVIEVNTWLLPEASLVSDSILNAWKRGFGRLRGKGHFQSHSLS